MWRRCLGEPRRQYRVFEAARAAFALCDGLVDACNVPNEACNASDEVCNATNQASSGSDEAYNGSDEARNGSDEVSSATDEACNGPEEASFGPVQTVEISPGWRGGWDLVEGQVVEIGLEAVVVRLGRAGAEPYGDLAGLRADRLTRIIHEQAAYGR